MTTEKKPGRKSKTDHVPSEAEFLISLMKQDGFTGFKLDFGSEGSEILISELKVEKQLRAGRAAQYVSVEKSIELTEVTGKIINLDGGSVPPESLEWKIVDENLDFLRSGLRAVPSHKKLIVVNDDSSKSEDLEEVLVHCVPHFEVSFEKGVAKLCLYYSRTVQSPGRTKGGEEARMIEKRDRYLIAAKRVGD